MKNLKSLFLAALATVFFALPASAHFTIVYTPEIAVQQSSDLDIRLIFTHPAEAGHTMDMGGVQEFYTMFQRGENAPQKIDLKEFLSEITWKNPESSGKAFAAKIPRKNIRSMGDYTFVLVPGFYFEKEEDIYMQQITKLVMNVGGIPGNWADPVGLPCEIVPLIKPYALWTGNIFKGQILSQGKPVPNAEVEVEYMSHMPDLKTNSMPAESSVDYPHEAFVTQTIFADDNGYISFGIPKAGWWGFAALGVGPEKTHKDKELSQDAVLWVKAVDMK